MSQLSNCPPKALMGELAWRPSTTKQKRSLRSRRIVNIEDLRRLARGRLPRVVFDFIDGGAEGEVTLRENRRIFETVTFRPRSAAASPNPDLRVKVLGSDLAFPVLLGPVGYTRLFHPQGELAAARAAGALGIGYVLSTMSGYKLEEVRKSSQAPLWYQLYPVGGRDVSEAVVERARLAGFSALVVTIDTPVGGLRERDVRNGTIELMSGNLIAMLPFFPKLLAHPAWLTAFLLDGGLHKLPNVIIPGKGPLSLKSLKDALNRFGIFTWDDFKWLHKIWHGPIVVKGVLTAEDALRAIDAGAQAIVVSNHGGRQLDGVQSSLRALPEIVKTVNGRVEVLLDGGIRRGSDVVKAISLGARAVLIGRAYIYGLAVGGEAGVARVLEILRTDVERTLQLLGSRSIANLDPSYVQFPDR
jgi:isopentenyl diphosphate isomerase/L-lactate dehydrogenase-like FMN-dependent dehydrogenase